MGITSSKFEPAVLYEEPKRIRDPYYDGPDVREDVVELEKLKFGSDEFKLKYHNIFEKIGGYHAQRSSDNSYLLMFKKIDKIDFPVKIIFEHYYNRNNMFDK